MSRGEVCAEFINGGEFRRRTYDQIVADNRKAAAENPSAAPLLILGGLVVAAGAIWGGGSSTAGVALLVGNRRKRSDWLRSSTGRSGQPVPPRGRSGDKSGTGPARHRLTRGGTHRHPSVQTGYGAGAH